MHDVKAALAHNADALVGEAVVLVILGSAGEEGLVEALALHAQEVNDVRFPIERIGPVAELFDLGRHLARHHGAGGEVGHLHAEAAEDEAGAARDAAVLDVADDERAAAGEVAVDFFEREGIQQRLRGMRVPAIAGIDDAGAGVFGDEAGDARLLVPHDDVIDAHGLQRLHGIEHALAFDDAAAFDVEVGDVRAEAAGGDFKAGARARGGLVKEREDGLAAQGRHFLHAALEEVFELHRVIQHELDFVIREGGDVEEVFAGREGHRLAGWDSMVQESPEASTSAKRTATRSPGWRVTLSAE